MSVEDYQIVIEHLSEDDGGGYIATVPELPGCMADGETRADALRHVEVAICVWVRTAEKLGRVIPKPRRAYA